MASWFSRRDFLPAGLHADQIELSGNMVRSHAHSADTAAACPRCGTVSRHVHSRYRRRLADLPAHGRSVELVLLVRRFRCRAMCCSASMFAERLPPAVARPHARRTSRLQGLVRHLGLALGGRPAQALAGRLLLPVSKDTFLRSVRTATEGAVADPRVISIDDWAWRKGHRYGTLICDLERRQVIDLLPNREPATVEAWLRARPGIEIVARDRNGGYGGAVSRGLPDAVQVAQIEASLPALATVRQLTDRFTDMVRNACEEALTDWIDEAEDSISLPSPAASGVITPPSQPRCGSRARTGRPRVRSIA